MRVQIERHLGRASGDNLNSYHCCPTCRCPVRCHWGRGRLERTKTTVEKFGIGYQRINEVTPERPQVCIVPCQPFNHFLDIIPHCSWIVSAIVKLLCSSLALPEILFNDTVTEFDAVRDSIVPRM